MKSAHREAAAAKRLVLEAWASEPEPDTSEYKDPTLRPEEVKTGCTNCGSDWHCWADCRLPAPKEPT